MESVHNFKVVPSQCYKFQTINSSTETCSFNNITERCYSWIYEKKEETILGEVRNVQNLNMLNANCSIQKHI